MKINQQEFNKLTILVARISLYTDKDLSEGRAEFINRLLKTSTSVLENVEYVLTETNHS